MLAYEHMGGVRIYKNLGWVGTVGRSMVRVLCLFAAMCKSELDITDFLKLLPHAPLCIGHGPHSIVFCGHVPLRIPPPPQPRRNLVLFGNVVGKEQDVAGEG